MAVGSPVSAPLRQQSSQEPSLSVCIVWCGGEGEEGGAVSRGVGLHGGMVRKAGPREEGSVFMCSCSVVYAFVCVEGGHKQNQQAKK